MINFVVVNSDKKQLKNTCDIIMKYMMYNQIDFHIDDFTDCNSKLLSHIKDKEEYLVYILNLELQSGNAVDLSRFIRNTNNDWISPIIFTNVPTNLYYELLNQRLQILDFIPKYELLEHSLQEDIEICLKILNKEKVYKFKYKNIEYNINVNSINYVQRDSRRTKIVTKKNIYHQIISINEIKKNLPNNFIMSAKGTLLNIRNVSKIDWKNMIVYFKDGTKDYVVTISHKKEIENYKI